MAESWLSKLTLTPDQQMRLVLEIEAELDAEAKVKLLRIQELKREGKFQLTPEVQEELMELHVRGRRLVKMKADLKRNKNG